MKVFRTLEDVERACLPDGLFQAIHDWLRELIECHEAAGFRFDPDADGHAVLVEQGDAEDAVRAARLSVNRGEHRPAVSPLREPRENCIPCRLSAAPLTEGRGELAAAQ